MTDESAYEPRMAHCHPSHRWTQRNDDSSLAYCACGVSEHSGSHGCPMHCALAQGQKTRIWGEEGFGHLAEIEPVEKLPTRTEKERCKWLGVQYLESDYVGYDKDLFEPWIKARRAENIFLGINEEITMELAAKHLGYVTVQARSEQKNPDGIYRNVGLEQDPHQ